MLEARGLTKRFRGFIAVDHVDFTIRAGEITGYLGPNGSGKSTTVKMMTGLLHPTEGHILFQGATFARTLSAFASAWDTSPKNRISIPISPAQNISR